MDYIFMAAHPWVFCQLSRIHGIVWRWYFKVCQPFWSCLFQSFFEQFTRRVCSGTWHRLKLSDSLQLANSFGSRTQQCSFLCDSCLLRAVFWCTRISRETFAQEGTCIAFILYWRQNRHQSATTACKNLRMYHHSDHLRSIFCRVRHT